MLFRSGTAFTYQGQLNANGSVANGIYDLRFTIYDAVTSGNVVSGVLTNAATPVANGLFTVTLDFGAGVFTGPARWLVLDVRTNGSGAFTTLLPRQPLLPMPYAIMANTASNLLGTLPAAQLSGTLPSGALAGYSGPVAFTNPADSFNGSFSGSFGGNGAGLSNLNGANLTAGSVGTSQLAGGALAAPVSIAGISQTAVANTSYFATNASPTTVYLPTNANIGDVVQVTGEGSGGWTALEYNPSLWTLTGAPGIQWQSVASSSDGTHLVAVANGIGGGIYTSTNSGTTWTLTGAPSTNWASVASSSDGIHLVAVVEPSGIYTSTNSGANWTQTGAPSENWIRVASSSDGTHLVAAVYFGGIYTSANSGAN